MSCFDLKRQIILLFYNFEEASAGATFIRQFSETRHLNLQRASICVYRSFLEIDQHSLVARADDEVVTIGISM